MRKKCYALIECLTSYCVGCVSVSFPTGTVPVFKLVSALRNRKLKTTKATCVSRHNDEGEGMDTTSRPEQILMEEKFELTSSDEQISQWEGHVT